MNSVNITGRLTADPDLRYDGNGRPTTLVRLAVSDRRNADSGIVFIDVLAFGARAQTAAHHLRKGRLVAVEGRLVQAEGANQHGRWQKHQVIASSIDFLDSPTAGLAPNGHEHHVTH